MSVGTLLLVYCSLILLASLAGGWVPLKLRLTHRRMEIALSFVSGVMLGVAFLHLLPHAIEERAVWLEGQPAAEHEHAVTPALLQPVVLWLLGGFVVMFLLERFLQFHQHEAPDDAAHDHDHGHNHGHGHDAAEPAPQPRPLTWAGAAAGLTIHSLIGGVALAASVEAAMHRELTHVFAGFAIFLAIFLHKPFDAVTLITLMSAGMVSRRTCHVANVLFALAIPVGALLFYLGLGGTDGGQQWLISSALAFSAGTFLCIALSDVLPELHFHEHDRVKLSAALVVGLAVAWGISRLDEGAHAEAEPATAGVARMTGAGSTLDRGGPMTTIGATMHPSTGAIIRGIIIPPR